MVDDLKDGQPEIPGQIGGDFDKECREAGGMIAKAYYDNMDLTNPSFNNNHYSGNMNTNRPKVAYLQRDGKNQKFEKGTQYEISLFDIESLEMGVADDFAAIRIWWSDNTKPEGPYTLSEDKEDSGRMTGVVQMGGYKTLTCMGKYMYIGAVDHADNSRIDQWPREGTKVCMNAEKVRGTGGPGPGTPPGDTIPTPPGTDEFGRTCDRKDGRLLLTYWDSESQKKKPGFDDKYFTSAQNPNNPKLRRFTVDKNGGQNQER